MKIRVKFSKTGHMRFVGHLDMLRYFQKAIRRSALPIKYSEGYSPHQIISFASALGLGTEGSAEYMDIELEDEKINGLSSAKAIALLNESMCEGMEILSFKRLPRSSRNAMSLVASAQYRVYFLKEKESGGRTEENGEYPDEVFLRSCIGRLMEREKIVVEKKSREKIVLQDIKPLIYRIEAEEWEGHSSFFLHISQGSTDNLKPQLLMEALHTYGELPRYPYRIRRTGLYTEEGRSLEEYGEDF